MDRDEEGRHAACIDVIAREEIEGRTDGKDRDRRTCNIGGKGTRAGGLAERSVNDRGGDARPRTERRLLFKNIEESLQSESSYVDESEKREDGIIDIVSREVVHGNKGRRIGEGCERD